MNCDLDSYCDDVYDDYLTLTHDDAEYDRELDLESQAQYMIPVETEYDWLP